MKLKSYLLIFFLSIYSQIYCQKYEIKWSDQTKKKEIETPRGVVKTKDGTIIINGLKKMLIKNMKLTKINENLDIIQLATSKDWKKKSWSKLKLFYLNSIQTSSGNYILAFSKENADKRKGLLVKKIKLNDDLTLSDEATDIGMIQTEKMKVNFLGAGYGLMDNNLVQAKSSPNKKYHVLYKFTERVKNVALSAIMLDSNLNVVWKNDIDLKVPQNNYLSGEEFVTDEGNLYFSNGVIIENKQLGGTKNSEYKFNLIHEKGQKLSELKLDFPEEHLDEVVFDNHPDLGYFNLVGLYSKKSNKDKYDGVVSMTIEEKTGEIIDKKVTVFSENEYEFFYKSRKAEKKTEKDKGIPNRFFLENFYSTADGGIVYVFESFEKTLNTRLDGKRQTTDTRIDFEDVILIKVTKEGNIAWRKLFPRHMGIVASGVYNHFPYKILKETPFLSEFSSKSLKIDDKIYVLYNDSERNIELQSEKEHIKTQKNKSKRVINYNKASTVMQIIDESTGKEKMEIIFDGKEEDTRLKTNSIKKVNDYSYLLFAQKKKKTQFGFLEVPKNKDYIPYTPPSNAAATASKTSKTQEIKEIVKEEVKTIDTIDGKAVETTKIVEKEVIKTLINEKPAEAPKPKLEYRPSSVSVGRRASQDEQDFFDQLRKQAKEQNK